jgi:DNA-binding NtrC family response regulator
LHQFGTIFAWGPMPELVLVVDDDPAQRHLLEIIIRRFGYQVMLAEGGDAAVKALLGSDASRIDAVVLDLVMPDLDGLGVLARMREGGLTIPVIVQTAHGGIDTVVSAMRAGATDFVVKPASAERLQVSLSNALATRALAGELQRLKRKHDGRLTIADVITRSEAMQPVLRAAEKAAASVAPVLIEGEPGVGKETVARAIHGSGTRRAKPFVAVNCGALPENLAQSILFGQEKGGFTGTTEKHAGKFVEADGGTLFLDDVGELPGPAQVMLLRALQQGEVEPVGGRGSVKVDVRIISASNRNLIADVKARRFREDLFYRLHVLPLSVPPLRARRDDIPELVRHFVTRFAAEEGKRIRAISAHGMALLAACHWPGNVRQLENAVFRAVMLANGEEIGIEEFPQIAAQVSSEGTSDPPLIEPSPAMVSSWPESDSRADANALGVTQHSLPLINPAGDVRPLEDIERDAIRFAISHYRGQMSEAARRLRIGRSTLYRKLEGLGLENA